MPLYEYECEKCHHRFERIQKFSDPPITECPVCGGPVHKLISSPAIQFKGSGWYITDYARKDSGAAGRTEHSESSKTEKSSKESTDGSKEGKPSKELKETKEASKSATPPDKKNSTGSSSAPTAATDS